MGEMFCAPAQWGHGQGHSDGGSSVTSPQLSFPLCLSHFVPREDHGNIHNQRHCHVLTPQVPGIVFGVQSYLIKWKMSFHHLYSTREEASQGLEMASSPPGDSEQESECKSDGSPP